jgi:hypothetical protein
MKPDSVGQLEGTLLKTASRSANTIALLQDHPSLASSATHMMRRMKGIEEERLRGIGLAALFDPTNLNATTREVTNIGLLDDLEYSLLCSLLQRQPTERNTILPRSVEFMDAVAHKKSVYAVWSSQRYRDSCVLYSNPGSNSGGDQSFEAGVIRKIFKHRHTTSLGTEKEDCFLVVRQYCKVAQEYDYYRQYGIAGGFLCDAVLFSVHVIELEQVVSHVARTEFADFEGKQLVHLIPLTRVSFQYLVHLI